MARLSSGQFRLSLDSRARWLEDERARIQGELTLDTGRLLTCGGDERILPHSPCGASPYGCRPTPERDLSLWSSSSASNPSPRGFDAARALHETLRAALDEPAPLRALDRLAEAQRRDLLALLGAEDEDADVVFCSSATDAELVPLLLVPDDGRPLVNVVVGDAEVGSGSVVAATARHFAHRSPLGGPVTRGAVVDGFERRTITCRAISLREDDGAVVDLAELDRRVGDEVERASRSGARVIVHRVDVSKTGLGAPSVALLTRLTERYGDDLVVVVDAAQGRTSATTLRRFLSLGFVVFGSGSKFFGGPSFSGAVLVPRRLAARRSPLPWGMQAYLSCADVPPAWEDWRGGLTSLANPGLLLRWGAALDEVGRYRALSTERRVRTSAALVDTMTAALSRAASVRPQRVRWSAGENPYALATIASFSVAVGGVPLDLPALHRLHSWMRLPAPSCVPQGASASERAVVERRFLLGQPLRLAPGGPAVLRIALSAPMLVHAAERAAGASEAGGDLDALFAKLDLLAPHALAGH